MISKRDVNMINNVKINCLQKKTNKFTFLNPIKKRKK